MPILFQIADFTHQNIWQFNLQVRTRHTILIKFMLIFCYNFMAFMYIAYMSQSAAYFIQTGSATTFFICDNLHMLQWI